MSENRRSRQRFINSTFRLLKQSLHPVLFYFNPRRRLATRIGLGLALLALVFSTLLSLFIGHNTNAQLHANREQSLVKLADTLANRLDRGMFDRYREIQIVTTLQNIRSSQTPSQQKQELLEKLQETYPDYAWIGLTDTEGHVVASTKGILTGVDVSARPWFIEARSHPYVGDVHEALLLAKLLPNPSQEPLRFVDIAAPVVDEAGQFQGVLGAHLFWHWAQKVEAELLEPLEELDRVESLILAENGTVLLGPNGLQGQDLEQASALGERSRGAFVKTWPDGNEYLTGFATTEGYRGYPGLGWRVLVRQPTAVAVAPARELQRQILLWGLSLGVLFAGLGWLMVDRITRPLLAIATVADRLRRGESEVTLRVLPGEDEMARLSWSLNKLLNALNSQEQTLLTTNDRLHQELLSRQRVEASLLKSEELSELKSHFFSLAAHEFRTPLTTILSSTELLERYSHKLTPQKKQQHFWRIQTSTQSMVQLLDEVLLVGKAEAGKLALNPVALNLSQWCANLVEEMQFSQGRQHAIDYIVRGIQTPAYLDEKLLRHALLNLLSNAIKYSPAGSPVRFELNFEELEVQFVVRDEGIGIPPADQQRLFQSFQRASNVGTIPGTGLGLIVVKQAVDLHHGRIELDSAVGVGTTFTITLPLVPQEQAIESLSPN